MFRLKWRKYRRGQLNVGQAALLRLALLTGAVTMLVPFAWMVCTALKDRHTMENEPQRWMPKLPAAVEHVQWYVDYVRATTADFKDVVLADFEPEARQDEQTIARHGTGALPLAVDFQQQQGMQRAIELAQGSQPERQVRALAFWLYGDRSGHRLRVRVVGDGFTYAATDDLRVQFEGWKEVFCFFRDEQFDPLGREVIQLRSDDPQPTDYVPLQGLRRIEIEAARETRAARTWRHWTYSFGKAWASMPFGRFYLNSLFVALAVTLGQVLTSSLAAYAFARLNFPGRDKLFFAYLATMMVPAAVTIVPTFILMKLLGWFDTYRALILPALFSAYGTFLLRQFFMGLPEELEDAAKIDGCSLAGIYWRITLPLSRPALATLAILTFMGNWRALMWPMVVTHTRDLFTLPVNVA